MALLTPLPIISPILQTSLSPTLLSLTVYVHPLPRNSGKQVLQYSFKIERVQTELKTPYER